MPKALRSIGGILLAMGLFAFAAGGWSIWSDRQFAENGVQATGTVVSFEQRRVKRSNSRGYRTMYRPVVTFDGQDGAEYRFVGQAGSSSPAYAIGERVNVIYDPWSPDDAIIDDFGSRQKAPLIFLGVGLIVGGIGAVLVYFFLRRQRLNAQLKASGMLVYAQYVDCERNRRTKVNGRSPYVVSVQGTHPTTGQSTTFESPPIWINLSAVLKGKTVPVRIDPSNPKHYFVDLSQWISEDKLA
ncbi:MAG: DUF3592 domain-containing protein [Altererythrobacter sp.]|nr:DUF3592 domain-containing protein [Altererythrobacter sp.]